MTEALLRTRESSWNVKAASYRDRNKKKSEYEEILVGMHDEVPGIDLANLKGKNFAYNHKHVESCMNVAAYRFLYT